MSAMSAVVVMLHSFSNVHVVFVNCNICVGVQNYLYLHTDLKFKDLECRTYIQYLED